MKIVVFGGKHIRWTEIETADAQQLSQDGKGPPPKPSRLAPGALILQEPLVVTERELMEQIADNTSLHYAMGLLSKIHGQLRYSFQTWGHRTHKAV